MKASDVAELPLPDVAGGWAAGAALWGIGVAACLWAVWSLERRRRRSGWLVEPRPHGPVPWQGVDVAQVFLVALACLMVAASASDGGPRPVRLAAAIAATCAATLAGAALLAARGATRADLGFGRGRLREDLALAGTALALVVAPLLAVAAILDRFVPYRHDIIDILADHRDPLSIGLVVVSAVVVAPVAEEFLFRRVLQGWLERLLPARDGAAAIGLAAAAFALAHLGQGLGFVPLFPFAVVLGILARRTGSLLPCVLLHGLFNAVSVGLILAGAAGGTG